MKKFTAKKVALMAILLCLLFLQEELLTALPNVQLTVLLIMVYGAVLGPSRGSLIVLCHVLLDNAVMGSLNPIVMLPMAVGWETVLLLGWLTRKSSLFFVAAAGVIGSLFYCWAFALANFLFLGIDVRYYLLADIPAEIILCVCSAVTLMFLYKPAVVLIDKYWSKS